MKSVCLGTIPVSEQHTGDNIVLWIVEILEKFGISTEKVVSFVHDNASNLFMLEKYLQKSLSYVSKLD